MFKNNATIGFVSLLILAMATRFIPHAPNFTAVGAAAIFGGYALSKRWQAFLLPVLIMFLSDLLINNVLYASFYESFQWFTPGFEYMYAAFILSVALGYMQSGKLNVLPMLATGVVASLLFFLITNFGVWQTGIMYPKTTAGLVACYVAGLPYLLNTVLGTLVYGTLLFGSAYYLIGFSVKKPQVA